ncbi:hypothetical protein F5146DRAFT_1005533 [Armillaria mellea]|nr:hypothetical protein F5146DRAFT_1005533 [Armillaria mellea]
MLNSLNWDNVVATGGSVLACMEMLPREVDGSNIAIQCSHREHYRTSDIDLFLYNLSPEDTEKKIEEIYKSLVEAVPHDVVCVRTKNAICWYLYRVVQIVLQLYLSVSKILTGFDVNSCCFAYDGYNFKAQKSGLTLGALLPRYGRRILFELWLVKYALHGYEILVPDLRHEDIDPQIYQHHLSQVKGLAHLLVMEDHSTNAIGKMPHPLACKELKTPHKMEIHRLWDAKYVRGHLQFYEQDPSQQLLSGSFNPVNVGEWSTEVYGVEADPNMSSQNPVRKQTVKKGLKKMVGLLKKSIKLTCQALEAMESLLQILKLFMFLPDSSVSTWSVKRFRVAWSKSQSSEDYPSAISVTLSDDELNVGLSRIRVADLRRKEKHLKGGGVM